MSLSMSNGAILALISTFLIVIIVVIGYLYNNRKFNELETDINNNMQTLVSQVNQTGFNKFEMDAQQNNLLKTNAQTLKDLQDKEKTDFNRLSKKLDDLKYTESEDMMRLSNDLTGIQSKELDTINDINNNISGMQSQLTNLGANVSILNNTVSSLPVDQQTQQIATIQSSISSLQKYNTNAANNLSKMQDQVDANSTSAAYIQSQLTDKLSAYLKTSDFNSYQLEVAGTYAKNSDLVNYAHISDVANNYVAKTDFSELQRQVTDNYTNVSEYYALKSDLSSYITTADTANFATKDLLSSYSKSSDLANFVLLDDYNVNLTSLSTQIDDITNELSDLPNSYGTKANVDNLVSIINTANTNLETIKSQYDNVIQNYVTKNTFNQALQTNLATELAEQSDIQSLQSSVTNLVTQVGQLPNVYLKISDAANTYAQQSSVMALQNQVNNLPDQKMKDSIQVYLNTQYATPASVANIQRQIDSIGNPAALYTTRNELASLQSQINLSVLSPTLSS